MTNRELLRAPQDRLSPVERQRRHVLQVESTPVPCPACKVPVDAVAASGRDVDEYAFGRESPVYRCPRCAAVLDRVTPLVAFGPGWLWQLNNDWLTALAWGGAYLHLQAARAAEARRTAAAAAHPAPDGAKLYAQHCAVCHGERGDGAGALSPYLDGPVVGTPEPGHQLRL